MKSEFLNNPIITTLDCNVAVSAGAGSGKTTSLAWRYVYTLKHHLQQGRKLDLGNILCITFTRMAALEMRERVRSYLQEEVAETPELQTYLDNFEHAQIVTMDSLQGKILREHPVEAGVDPQYVVTDPAEYQVLMEGFVRRFLRDKVASKDEHLSNLMGAYEPRKIRDALLTHEPLTIADSADDYTALQTDFDGFADKQKRNRDILSYVDVHRRCLELLRNCSEVRHHYQKQYRYIMVDEFQDTDDGQQELVYLLCQDPKDLQNLGKELCGQKLFVVGDKKQSIYRFRGAQVSLFEEVQNTIKDGGGEVFSMTTNYRSTDKILNLTNHVFDQEFMFKKDGFEALSPVSQNMESSEQSTRWPVMKFFAGENLSGKWFEKRKWLLEQEAAEVAKRIQSLAQDGMKYGSMAVLLTKRTQLPLLVEHLVANGIPYVCIGGSGFYQQQEIYDVLNMFRVLRDKQNDLALLGFLRSPFVGASDVELTVLCRSTKECLLEHLTDEGLSDKLQHVGRVLQSLYATAQNVGLPELWQRAATTFEFTKVLLSQPNGEQKLANVLKLESLALEYAEGKVCGLAEWLDLLEETMSTSKETAANLPSEDMVQIMTVHKSKGLGFDCVFVPFLAEEKARGEGDEKEQDAFERRRLLYVAMTRAKKYLYMSASAHNLEKCLAKPSAGAWLWRALHKPVEILPTGRQRKSRWGWEQFENLVEGTIKEQGVRVEGQGLRSEELINPSVACGTSCVRRTQFNPQQGSQAVVSAVPSRTTFTPTMLQTYLHCPRSYYYRYICGLPEVDEGQGARSKEQGASEEQGNGLTPAEMGTLIHSALEHYDGDVETAWASALRAQGSGFRTQDSGVSFAKTLFVNYVNSDLFKQIPQQHDREVKFQLPIDDGVSFQGIMDCVYRKQDGTYGIVDYKTGGVPDELNEGYAMQLAIYGEAVSKMYRGAEVSELALHYLQGCVKKSVPGGKLQEAVALAKVIQEKHTEADFDRNTEQCAHCGYQYLCRKDGKE